MNRWAAMEAFVRVVETGSFSAAARQLHPGQPAVSKMIAQLEEVLVLSPYQCRCEFAFAMGW